MSGSDSTFSFRLMFRPTRERRRQTATALAAAERRHAREGRKEKTKARDAALLFSLLELKGENLCGLKFGLRFTHAPFVDLLSDLDLFLLLLSKSTTKK